MGQHPEPGVTWFHKRRQKGAPAMKQRKLLLILVTLILGITGAGPAMAQSCPAFLDHELRRLHSSDSVNLCDLSADKPMMVVNTASRCGYTGQFEGLETLHQRYQKQGLVVVGFASNDFRQEADSEQEAAEVCFKNFGVTFTMIAPSSVTGAEANPVFDEINTQSQPPLWNFTKYLIDREGEVVKVFPSRVRPNDRQIIEAVESLLGSS